MHLEHINLVVKDLDRSLQFYKAAFPHWQVRAKGQATWYGVNRNWLHFGDEYQYITLNDGGLNQNRDLQSNMVGLAHFGYCTSNLSSLIKRMQQAGFNIAKPGADCEHRKNVYYIDPDGFEIEFVEYLSDLPIERNEMS